MSQTFNIYCDESCHLENDGLPVMVLGAVWCSLEKTREIAMRIREEKAKNGLHKAFEIKWVKVSRGKLPLYRDIIDYFFDDDDIHFRALIIPDKDRLRHQEFKQDHDTWYYKMCFTLLEPLLNPEAKFRIYLDKKDTRSAIKTHKLHDVLCNNMYDFDRKIIERVQTVTSHEVEQLQLADLLIGAVGYANRKLESNPAKVALVERIKTRSGYSLLQSTLLQEKKFNLFRWQAQ